MKFISPLNRHIKNINVKNWKVELRQSEPENIGHGAQNMTRHLGHMVDGFIPRLIVLENCDCYPIRHRRGCECLEKRLENALKLSICTIFGDEERIHIKKGFEKIIQHLEQKVYISCSMATSTVTHYLYLTMQKIFNRYQIPYTTDETYSSNTNQKLSLANSNCKIHFVNYFDVLGREFENLIYLAQEELDLFIDPISKDIKHSYVLQNVSRAKSQFHVIHPGAKVMNNWMIDLLHTNRQRKQEHNNAWILYTHEIITAFLYVDLIRNGSMMLLPLPTQKFMDQDKTIELLMDGRDLIEKLKLSNKYGGDMMKSGKRNKECQHRAALKVFARSIMVLQARLIGTSKEHEGVRFDPLYNFTDHSEVNHYLNEIKIQEYEIFLKCGQCLLELDSVNEAFLIFKFLTEDFPGDSKQLDLLQETIDRILDPRLIRGLENKYQQLKGDAMAWEAAQAKDCPNAFIIEKGPFILSNMKKHYIESIIKPYSGYKEEWYQCHFGFEINDL